MSHGEKNLQDAILIRKQQHELALIIRADDDSLDDYFTLSRTFSISFRFNGNSIVNN